jgi:hypothetical protein
MITLTMTKTGLEDGIDMLKDIVFDSRTICWK